MDIAIVHYNTPELTGALVQSIRKWMPAANVTIFENSDDPRRKLPPSEGVTVIGASSDHLVVDVQERPGLQVGDSLTFRLFYQGMLYAFQSADVEKVYTE